MHNDLELLLSRYEKGQIGRRELLAVLATIAAGSTTGAAAQPAIGAVTQLNHVTVFVKDVQKSVAFYQELFGMPVLTPQDPGINLKAGAGFLGVYPAEERPTGINHLCLGIEKFEADLVLKKLKDKGLDANIRLRGDTKELYFTDPDNIRVQLQDVRYRGGTGPLGDRDPRR